MLGFVVAIATGAGCASRPPSQTLKAENRRLHDELADARRHQAASDARIEALEAQLARLQQATKGKDSELDKLRTETAESSRERADARRVAEAAAKLPPPVQCPPGSLFDPAAKQCVAIAVAVPAPPPPAPPSPPPPVTARIIKLAVDGDAVVCTLGTGNDAGVAKTWRAQVLRGDTRLPLVGGKAEIVRVDRRTTVVRVKLTPETVRENPTVLLAPP